MRTSQPSATGPAATRFAEPSFSAAPQAAAALPRGAGGAGRCRACGARRPARIRRAGRVLRAVSAAVGFVVFVAALRPAAAQVYQYAVAATSAQGDPITAFLWIPPQAERVRGVLVGGSILMEPAFAGDPVIRKACAAEDLAIVYFHPSLDALFDYEPGDSDARLKKALGDLAEASGYAEIAGAPLFPFGHSVGSIFASHVVCWAPERCFGALSFKGGLMTHDSDPDASLAGVPILVIKGQFEEFGPGPSGVLRDFEDRETAWKGMRDGLLRRRRQDDELLVSYLVEPGGSHFAWSDRLAPYAAMFLRKAAQRRIPADPAGGKGPVECRKIDPAGGALSSGNIGRRQKAAPYDQYEGDPGEAFWHLDLELARANDAFHAGMFDKRPQFVTFADPQTDKPILVGHDLRLRMGVDWVGPAEFQVAGTFLDHAPDKYPEADGPVGHAPGPVRFRAFGGAIEQVAADRFRVAANGRQRIRAEIMAYRPGNQQYRYAEQQGRIRLPKQLTQGTPQKITFPKIGKVRAGDLPLELRATSDAGLPVRFYVASGPAVVRGGKLHLAEVPRRAAYPLRIKVVAWQYGSAVEPLVQSAEPVWHAILVSR